MKNLKEAILNFMKTETYCPLNSEAILEKMEIKGDRLKEFWQDFKELEDEGAIVKTRTMTYGVPSKMGLVVGTLSLTDKGFGFVISDDKSVEEDLFIPPSMIATAMNGDKVMARVSSRSTGKRPDGEIIRILKRVNEKVVGTFIQNGDFGFVVPDNKKIGMDIYVPRRYFNKVKNKQKVVCQITVWPTSTRKAEGKIVEILGNVGDVGLEILSIIKQNNLAMEFPAEVMQAAEKISQEIKESDLKGRRDLRNLPLITVDGEDAKDLDDAIYVKKQGENYLLGVYIADVSYYVRENQILDLEARMRGTSVYLVDRVLPMLPRRLSNGICSLNEGVDRLAMACEMLIDAKGLVKSYDIFEAVIKVKHRMTYTAVRKILVDGEEELKEQYKDIVPMLDDMKKLCHILKEKRRSRGSLDFELPEQKVILDEKGKPIEIVPRIRSIAEFIVEEFMLSANETVAKHMSEQKWPFVYRVHDLPDMEKLGNLARLLNTFNVQLQLGDEPDSKKLQAALNQMKDEPEEKLVNTIALRSMKQAVYQTENLGHFGLGANYYTHFTSPIRRYPDLIVHRLLRKWMKKPVLSSAETDNLEANLKDICENSSKRERAAAEAERQTVDLKMAEYMVDHIGEDFVGTISSVTSFGFFVELENGVEGLVHISSLVDDYYLYEEDKYALIGENTKQVFRMGDKVKIEVLKVNIEERNIDFILYDQSELMKDYIKANLEQKNRRPKQMSFASPAGKTRGKLNKKKSKKNKNTNKNVSLVNVAEPSNKNIGITTSVDKSGKNNTKTNSNKKEFGMKKTSKSSLKRKRRRNRNRNKK